MIHQVANFLRVDAAQRTAGYGEILAERRDGPAVHDAHSCHHAVTGQIFVRHAKMFAIVVGMQAGFLKRAGLKQGSQPFTRGHHTFCPAGRQLVLATAGAGSSPPFFKVVQ